LLPHSRLQDRCGKAGDPDAGTYGPPQECTRIIDDGPTESEGNRSRMATCRPSPPCTFRGGCAMLRDQLRKPAAPSLRTLQAERHRPLPFTHWKTPPSHGAPPSRPFGSQQVAGYPVASLSPVIDFGSRCFQCRQPVLSAASECALVSFKRSARSTRRRARPNSPQGHQWNNANFAA
jgi:hypothetical protein